MLTGNPYRFDWTAVFEFSKLRVQTVRDSPSSESVTYPAKQFATGVMFCPRCSGRMTEPAVNCSACGFTGEHTLAMFPGAAPAMEEFMDTAQCWSEKDVKFLREQIAKMRKRFPQIHWCLLSIRASEQMPLRLFNFWFFNVSPAASPEEQEQRHWTILLTFEKTLGQFAVMPGYRLEAMLSDDEWYDLLNTIKVSWREGGMKRAYRDFFRDAEAKLSAASKRINDMIQRSRARSI